MIKLKDLLKLDEMVFSDTVKERHSKKMKRKLVYIHEPVIAHNPPPQNSSRETREELVKREKMMKEESNYKEIQSNHKVSRKPMHELYKGINKQINNFEKWKDERTPWTKMGGPTRDKR